MGDGGLARLIGIGVSSLFKVRSLFLKGPYEWFLRSAASASSDV